MEMLHKARLFSYTVYHSIFFSVFTDLMEEAGSDVCGLREQ